MSTQRVLKFINLSIAVFLVVFIGAGFWYAWRPLPVTSGTISAPISKQAVVARDSLGALADDGLDEYPGDLFRVHLVHEQVPLDEIGVERVVVGGRDHCGREP